MSLQNILIKVKTHSFLGSLEGTVGFHYFDMFLCNSVAVIDGTEKKLVSF